MKSVGTTPELFEFEGKSPSGESVRLIRFPLNALLKHFDDMCNTSMRDEAWWVPDVCEDPAGIWRGLNRSDQNEAFCYCGVPSGRFAKQFSGPQIEFAARFVLMVFLDPQLEVVKWRKCLADSTIRGFPVQHESRFGERLWPTDVQALQST
jgi:hypothetical protein